MLQFPASLLSQGSCDVLSIWKLQDICYIEVQGDAERQSKTRLPEACYAAYCQYKHIAYHVYEPLFAAGQRWTTPEMHQPY